MTWLIPITLLYTLEIITFPIAIIDCYDPAAAAAASTKRKIWRTDSRIAVFVKFVKWSGKSPSRDAHSHAGVCVCVLKLFEWKTPYSLVNDLRKQCFCYTNVLLWWVCTTSPLIIGTSFPKAIFIWFWFTFFYFVLFCYCFCSIYFVYP